MNNFEMVKLAEKQLGNGGATYRSWAGLGSGQPWCNAFVSWLFAKSDNASLYCDGRKETYCPDSIKWCYNHLAVLPIYLVMPGDVVYFDWEPNGIPNHVGIVKERISDLKVSTIEGNTSGSKVANRTRTEAEVQNVFRPHFHVDPSLYSSTKKLEVDSYFGYSTIAVMQRWLGVTQDAILGQGTVKALQKKLGVTQDGSWGKATSKALQKLIGTTVDGAFGAKSVKAFQTYLNKQVFPSTVKKTLGDKIAETAKKYVGKVPYVKGGTDIKKGVDCTGFVQEVYRLNGITLDNKLSDWGKSIGTDISKAQPGDIITYKRNGKVAHHGIYVGNGKICHAANEKDDVCIGSAKRSGMTIEGIRRRWK